MSQLIDQAARERFTTEIKQPFSVIAPAGVGKTHAIVDRVLGMLTRTEDVIALVTYTKKAAEEMRVRLEEAIAKEEKLLPYDRLFIGTIHSLCAELLKKHTQEWNIPGGFEVVANTDILWSRFKEEVANPFEKIPQDAQARYLKYFEEIKQEIIFEVGGAGASTGKEANELFLPPPLFPFNIILEARFTGSEKRTIDRLKAWVEKLISISEDEIPVFPELPTPPKEESKVYGVYEQFFGPYKEWLATEGMKYIRVMASEFKTWRRAKGLYVYDDLLELVYEKSPENYGLSVVLDEAQDTSPIQLKLLKKLSFTRDKRIQLTMVGDPQQSIYSARASLPDYLETHRSLIKNHGAEELTFNVTFRCSEAVVAWVNKLGCDGLFSKSPTQADFVPLNPRPGASTGDVSCWRMVCEEIDEDLNTEERDWLFARAFAAQFKARGFPVEAAHQIAILAPRRDWLFKLATAFGECGILVQLHAETSLDNPAEQLLKSILHLMKNPFDSFELIGFLREVYEVDDVTLATVAQKTPELLTFVSPPSKELVTGFLFDALQELHTGWTASKDKSLPRAITGFIESIRLEGKIEILAEVYGDKLRDQWQREYSRVLALASSTDTLKALLEKINEASPDAPVEVGALQLMTIHKAKGLQWPVVLLPFLHRPNNSHKASYPMVDPDSHGRRLTWKLSPTDTRRKERENFERLLYVSMTRAQEQLILVDDSGFYNKTEFSAAEALGVTKLGVHFEAFQRLPVLEDLILRPIEKVDVVPEPISKDLLKDIKLIPVRTPSSFVTLSHIPEGELPEKGGVDYGDFWHNLWLGKFPTTQAEDVLLKKALESRFADRALEDLKKLFVSPLWLLIKDPQSYPRTEVPFFAMIKGDNIVLEGRVDLILTLPEKTLIVDWKTDQLPREKLLESYAPQLLAYKKAFETLTGGGVEVSLYSTVLGEWLPLV